MKPAEIVQRAVDHVQNAPYVPAPGGPVENDFLTEEEAQNCVVGLLQHKDLYVQRVGACAWKASRRIAVNRGVTLPDDSLFWEVSSAFIHEVRMADHPHAGILCSKIMFAVKWAHDAFTKLILGERYAAALMSTHVTADIGDVPLGWQAFLVVVPGQLLSEFDRIGFVWSPHLEGQDAKARLLFYSAARDDIPIMIKTATTVEKLLLEPVASTGNVGDPLSDREERIVTLAQRLVCGALLTCAHTTNWRQQKMPIKFGKLPRIGPPEHRVVMVGKPMTLDVRPAVRSYLAGSSAPPAVQSLVRGHYKRQVVGIGRGGRRVIWIEPYWRGPEEAPILTRPRRVG